MIHTKRFTTGNGYINGLSTDNMYHAELITLSPSSGTVEAEYIAMPGNIHTFKSDIKEIKLNGSFLVSGNSKDALEKNTLALVRDCCSCVVSSESSLVEYKAVLEQYDVSKIGIYNYVKLTWSAVQRGKLLDISLPAVTVHTKGNNPAPCRIILNPNESISSLTIMGITIVSLSADEQFIIDGIDSSITDFARTDMIDFPKLQPNMNYLGLTHDIKGKIEYHPVY